METVEATRVTFTVRPIEARDQADLVRFYADLSDDSREARFHGAVRGIGQGLASSFCHPDHEHREGVVAEADEGPCRPVLIGHVCLEPTVRGEIEMAIAVADRWQRRGVGAAMLRAAIAWAQDRGTDRLVATVRCGSGAVIGLVRSLGLPATVGASADGGIELRIDLRPAALPAA
jgi:acetyltransferase